jgi:hypothetical protein
VTHGHPDDHHNQQHGDEDHTRVAVIGGVTPTTIQPDDAAAAGSSTTAAAADHKHAIVAATAGAIQPDDAAAEGSATSFARSDHKHSIVADVAGAIQPDDAAAEGSATSFARSDHKHSIVGATPVGVAVGTTAAEGSATSFARSDHAHSLSLTVSFASVGTNQTTTSASYTDLATAGPEVTLTTGTAVVVTVGCQLYNATGGSGGLMSFAVSGATTSAASNARAWGPAAFSGSSPNILGSRTFYLAGLTGGSNTFTAKYMALGNTAGFLDRQIIVERLN